MSIAPFTLFSGVLILGIVLLLVGRTMNTHTEEQWKEEYWWREMIYSLPGYYRASTIMLSVVFIVVGAVGLYSTLRYGIR